MLSVKKTSIAAYHHLKGENFRGQLAWLLNLASQQFERA